MARAGTRAGTCLGSTPVGRASEGWSLSAASTERHPAMESAHRLGHRRGPSQRAARGEAAWCTCSRGRVCVHAGPRTLAARVAGYRPRPRGQSGDDEEAEQGSSEGKEPRSPSKRTGVEPGLPMPSACHISPFMTTPLNADQRVVPARHGRHRRRNY